MSKTQTTLAGMIAALFPNSEKAVSERLEQSEFDAFTAEVTELQNRLDAQAAGNVAIAADLVAAQAATQLAEAGLDSVNAQLAELAPQLVNANAKAAQWDAYKASLSGMTGQNDSTNAGPKPETGEDAHLTRMATLKEKYPLLMADVEVA